ncbi:MAG: hypothetical protein AB1403_24965 [Candidatus Riflebacteria bacterium]
MKARSFVLLGSLFNILLQCMGFASEKHPVKSENPSQDCVKFDEIIKNLKAKGQIDQPVWRHSYSDITSPDFSFVVNNEGGQGLICESEVAAGGQQVWMEGAPQSMGQNEVSYSLRVYEAPEQVESLVSSANAYQGVKLVVSKNRVFSYYVDKSNEKNVSKVIVKAAEDFLKSTE